MEVLYTVIQSLTMDGRDRGLDYKLSGFHVPPGSRDAQVLGLVGLKGQSGAGVGWVEGAVASGGGPCSVGHIGDPGTDGTHSHCGTLHPPAGREQQVQLAAAKTGCTVPTCQHSAARSQRIKRRVHLPACSAHVSCLPAAGLWLFLPPSLQVLDCIAPGPDEIVLPKTSSSVFLSTPLHYLLQNLGVRQLVLCGCVTGVAMLCLCDSLCACTACTEPPPECLPQTPAD